MLFRRRSQQRLVNKRGDYYCEVDFNQTLEAVGIPIEATAWLLVECFLEKIGVHLSKLNFQKSKIYTY